MWKFSFENINISQFNDFQQKLQLLAYSENSYKQLVDIIKAFYDTLLDPYILKVWSELLVCQGNICKFISSSTRSNKIEAYKKKSTEFYFSASCIFPSNGVYFSHVGDSFLLRDQTLTAIYYRVKALNTKIPHSESRESLVLLFGEIAQEFVESRINKQIRLNSDKNFSKIIQDLGIERTLQLLFYKIAFILFTSIK